MGTQNHYHRSLRRQSPEAQRSQAAGSRAAVSSLCLAILVLIFARSRVVPEGLSLYVPALAAIPLAIGVIASPPRGRLHGAQVGLILLGFVMALTSIPQVERADLFKAWGIAGLWTVTVLATARLSCDDSLKLRRFVAGVGLLECILIIVEQFDLVPGMRNALFATSGTEYVLRENRILGAPFSRSQGTLGYPIAAANFLVIAAVCAFSNGVLRKGTVKIGYGALISIAVLFTGTRSAIAAIIAVLMVMMVGRYQRRSLPPIVTASAMAGAAMVGYAVVDQALADEDYSISHRLDVLAIIPRLLDRPATQVLFGSGYNSHNTLVDDLILTPGQTNAIDNAFVMVLVAAGLLGLALLLLAFVRVLLRGDEFNRAIVACMMVFGAAYDLVWLHLIALLACALMNLHSNAPYHREIEG